MLNTKVSVARNMCHSICSDGHFSTIIGRHPYWSALGSFTCHTLPTTTTAVSTELIIFVAVE